MLFASPRSLDARFLNDVQLFFVPMQKPSQLLLIESPTIARYYENGLQAAGFDVTVAHDAASALVAYRNRKPNVISVDPILPAMDALEFIACVRATSDSRTTPICLLPNSDAALSQAALSAGANRGLAREEQPLQTLTAMSVAFCQINLEHWHPNPLGSEHWVGPALQHVVTFRACLHAVIRNNKDEYSWNELTRQAHMLTETLALANQPGLSQLALSTELLILDMRGMPEQMNSSVTMTLGQSADFLTARLGEVGSKVLPCPSGSRVLVVDDDLGARELISASIQTAGLMPQVVESPSACLSAVKKDRFDLVFLDVGLPEMTGFELCSKVRSTPGHDTVPIVFLTGLTNFQNRAQSSLAGGNDFIGKPFHPLELGLKALLWVNKGHLGQAA
jgi:PleD family two-component response regulator